MFALIACAALLAADAPPVPTPVAPDAPGIETRAEYEVRRREAGRTPDDQVRLAYWCEAHGLAAERLRHLALAVLADPDHAAARGLMGLVSRDQRWLKPEAVADRVKADPTLAANLAEYDARRSTTPYTADGQWTLATWADEHGLTEQARAHLTAVVRLDPKRDAAWKRLGFRKVDGRWTTDAEVAAAKADADAQKAADKKWKPLLERWKAQIGKPNQRDEAEANLLTVTDPRALPMIIRVFGVGSGASPLVLRVLGQIDAPAATKTLASLAAFAPSPDIRRVATETLRSRDPREYANLLIPLIRKPIQYEVEKVNGPNMPGVLFIRGDKANSKRVYQPKSLIDATDRITVDRFGQPVVERVASFWAYSKGGRAFNPLVLTGVGYSYSDEYMYSNTMMGNLSRSGQPWANSPLGQPGAIQSLLAGPDPVSHLTKAFQAQEQAQAKASHNSVLTPGIRLGDGTTIDPRDAAQQTSVQRPLAQIVAETNRSSQVSQQQLDNDVAQIEGQNLEIRATNDRIVGLLNEATGENLPAVRTEWERWYVNLLGYAFVASQSQPNPTFVEVIPSGYQPEVAPTNTIVRGFYVSGQSCFGAGTPVQTVTGPRPIESLAVGDLVLTQSVSSGALGYHPVLVTHHNPPATTFRIRLGDDTIVSSQFHRFWVARRGWVMARDLKAGEPIRTLAGVRPIDAVEVGKVELVYNLDIADDADFFAGASAALVHDNTLPDPRLVPFDRPADDRRAVAAR